MMGAIMFFSNWLPKIVSRYFCNLQPALKSRVLILTFWNTWLASLYAELNASQTLMPENTPIGATITLYRRRPPALAINAINGLKLE
jgi:hypothetical protein